jgi:hypothetical protein
MKMPASSNDFQQDPFEIIREYVSNPIPWSVAPRSGLHVTEEMKKILARPGFLKTTEGGDRLRKLYINRESRYSFETYQSLIENSFASLESIGFNPENLSPFGRNCYYGILREVVQVRIPRPFCPLTNVLNITAGIRKRGCTGVRCHGN